MHASDSHRGGPRAAGAGALFALGLTARLASAAPPEQAVEATGLPPQPVIDAAVAAKLPASGYWFATKTSHGARSQGPELLYVYRLRPTGLEVVLRVPDARVDDLAWLDAHTLLTVEVDRNANVITQRIVDGVAEPPITIPETAWKVTKAQRTAKRTEVHTPDGSMLVTRKRAVWMRRCVAARRNADRCDTWHYLRIDGKTPTLSTQAPANVFDPDVYPAPRSAAPAGIKVKLARVVADVVSRRGVNKELWKGFTCSGPGGQMTWPTDDPAYDPSFPIAVDTITWRSTQPPVFEVSGQATDPLARRFRRSELFRACEKSPIDSVRWLPGGLRADAAIVSVGGVYLHALWTVSLGDVPVAVLVGTEGRLAMAPTK